MSVGPTAGVVFCAGYGTRMRELVKDRPKPMVPLRGRPMVDHAVDLLRGGGIANVFANTHHLASAIEPHLDELGVTYRREAPDILDTGGGLKALAPALPPGPIVTLNPDAAWRGPNPVAQLLSAWRPSMDCLLLVTPVEKTERPSPADFGIRTGKIFRKGDFVYTGAQIIRPEHVARIEAQIFSLNVVWDELIAGPGVDAVIYDGAWRDIGTPEGLAKAEDMVDDVQA